MPRAKQDPVDVLVNLYYSMTEVDRKVALREIVRRDSAPATNGMGTSAPPPRVRRGRPVKEQAEPVRETMT